MLFSLALLTLLFSLPSATPAPTTSIENKYANAPSSPADTTYMCGYVMTIPNDPSFSHLSAYDLCMPIYINETISDYQEAYSYNIWGGFKCGFYTTATKCEAHEGELLQGPTKAEMWQTEKFEGERPKWYSCAKT